MKASEFNSIKEKIVTAIAMHPVQMAPIDLPGFYSCIFNTIGDARGVDIKIDVYAKAINMTTFMRDPYKIIEFQSGYWVNLTITQVRNLRALLIAQ